MSAPTDVGAEVEAARDGAPEGPTEAPSGARWVMRDSWAEAMRHLRIIPRNSELLIFSTIQPVMFVLLFVYVFGGSIATPGYDGYKQYLMPGIFAQTVVFGSAFTGTGLAEDLSKGMIDRLRSLPMAQSAVLVGRTVSDLLRNALTMVIMFAVAFAVGFRFRGSLVDAVLATLLLLFFSYAFSWVQALIALSTRSVEAASSAGFIWMFPLTFVSSAFVVTDNMPGWLRGFADANPFTKVTNAVRALYNDLDPGNDVWIAFAWAAGMTAVFATLSIRKFRTSTSR